jgi:hypothetical protein
MATVRCLLCGVRQSDPAVAGMVSAAPLPSNNASPNSNGPAVPGTLSSTQPQCRLCHEPGRKLTMLPIVTLSRSGISYVLQADLCDPCIHGLSMIIPGAPAVAVNATSTAPPSPYNQAPPTLPPAAQPEPAEERPWVDDFDLLEDER